MWKYFLETWNGVSMFVEDTVTQADALQLWTDASDVGFAGYYEGNWFQSPWQIDEMHLDRENDVLSMAFKELYPIVVSALLWDSAWSRKRINFNCDNVSTVEIIRKGRSKSPAIMKLTRTLTYRAAMHSYVVTSEWLPSAANGISDSLSRFEQTKFWQLVGTQAAPHPCRCPPPCEVLMF